MRVLVVDDDTVSLELYARELQHSYQVITSETIRDAARLLATEEVDVLVMEPMVDESRGWEFLTEICAEGNHMPVILCSVNDDRKTGLDRGAREYLVKPVLPATLHRVVDQVLDAIQHSCAGR